MILWLAMFMFATVLVGIVHKSGIEKDDRSIRLNRIRRRLAEKEAEEKQNSDIEEAEQTARMNKEN